MPERQRRVALFLQETGLPYEIVPVDTAKDQQPHTAEFRAINPNGRARAIVDRVGAGAETHLFDPTRILLYLGEKTGKLIGRRAVRPSKVGRAV